MNPTEIFNFDQRTQDVLENLTIPFAIYQYIDKRVVTVALSRGFCDEFGFESLEDAYHVMNNDMYRATHPDDKTRVADAAYRFAAFDVPYDIVYRTRTLKDSDYIILHAYGKSIYPTPGVRLCLTWYAFEGRCSAGEGMYESVLNQTLNHFLTEESRHRGVYYDHMTGLPNMAYFTELAEAGRERMRDRGVGSAVLFFDLTGLKHFNHRHGFDEGNRLIRCVASILASHFSSENCARFAQDHFAAFTPEVGLKGHLDAIIDECAEANDGKTLPIRIGVYPDEIEAVEVGVACDRAKLAANTRRKSEESFYAYFDMDMMAEEKNRQEIIDNLDRAIEEGRIRVFYQPIVRATNGKVCNVEALARWHDPARGLLMPGSFIPVLEESMLIAKLDLCIVRQVLDDLKSGAENGYQTVPVSINFSRADFDAYDLVDEICSLVDEAQVDRKLINIEITESMVGSDFDYMKGQIERFRAQGFQVWMDDFGSGYSSLDVLQSVKFDLIKFDMGFMRRLDEGDEGKIILTELMKMATSLGVSTICEGVETEHQVRFLQEIGCSKLQGYYFMKPAPLEQIIEKYAVETSGGFEDPQESAYCDMVGRINLYDLSFLANLDGGIAKNTFDTVPMGIMEVNGDGEAVRYVRSNQSFRDFMKRAFLFDLSDPDIEYPVPKEGPGSTFMQAIWQCRGNGDRAFVDEKMGDGSTVHSFVRVVGKNPVNGRESIAIAVLSVTEPDEGATYADIAQSLAADYYNLFVIDLDTNDYIEYSSRVGDDKMSLERHGEDFFESARRDTMTRIYEEDREPFLALFTKDNVLRELDAQGMFTTTYRLTDFETPTYVNMKITRMREGNRLILGVSIVDAHMRQLEEERRLRREKASLKRVAALSPSYIVLYTVDLATGHYTQYNPSNEYEAFGLAAQGDDFFADVKRDASKAIFPEDIEGNLRVLTEENMVRVMRREGFFTHSYRLLLDGKPVPVNLRATLVQEDDGEKIILGVAKNEEASGRELEEAQTAWKLNRAVIYTHLAHALARGYSELFYVNMDTDEFIEFHTDDERGVLNEARRGTDFFEGCERDAKLLVHPEDQPAFVEAMNREFLSDALGGGRVFELTYRRIRGGEPFYVQMKASRLDDDDRIVVIAVTDIDELMRKRRAEERMQEERIVYARLQALTGNFICVYVVDPETGAYHEFSATADYEKSFSQAKEGTDFFSALRESARVFSYSEDRDRALSLLTRDNVMAEIERSGIFTLGYRIMMGDSPVHFQLKAAMVEEKEGPRLIVGLNDIDLQVRQQEEYGRRLAQAQRKVSVDALTGVKSKHAYLDAEAQMDQLIAEGRQAPFAIVVFDVNDLKKVNDTSGHQSGDRYLREGCRRICDIFKHSAVYRIGGDEFAVISKGRDYECIESLLAEVRDCNAEASCDGGVVVACGMSRFQDDECMAKVFERADRSMYENKTALKSAPVS